MPRFRPALPIRSAVAVLALGLLLPWTAACSGGGGGSSPTAPSPTPPANVAGSWTGTGGVDSAEGYCTEAPVDFRRHDVDLEITQEGAAIDVRWTNRPPFGRPTCQFVGTVSGNTFTLTPDLGRSDAGCGQEHDFLCGRRVVRRVLDVDSTRAEGTVSGDQIEVRSASVFEFYDKQTGQLLGEATYHATTDVTRVR